MQWDIGMSVVPSRVLASWPPVLALLASKAAAQPSCGTDPEKWWEELGNQRGGVSCGCQQPLLEPHWQAIASSDQQYNYHHDPSSTIELAWCNW